MKARRAYFSQPGHRILRVFILIALLASAIAIFVVRFFLYSSPGRREFSAREAQYNRLVQKFKSLGMKPGKPQFFYIETSLDLSTLHEASAATHSSMLGRIMARHAEEGGGYQVSIITQDLGHMGASGYLYSDFPLEFSSENKERIVNTSGDLRYVREQLNTNWWIVYNNDF